jgi:hypothetical protein
MACWEAVRKAVCSPTQATLPRLIPPAMSTPRRPTHAACARTGVETLGPGCGAPLGVALDRDGRHARCELPFDLVDFASPCARPSGQR